MASKCYINNNFFEFIVRKEIPFECLEEDFANFAGEDSFNSDVAEKALEIAFELFPDKPGEDEDDTMEKRHEFVDGFLEYARCEVVKKWASNLGMYTKEEAQANVDTQREVCKKYWQKKVDIAYNDGFDEGVNETLNKFRKKSAYQFSAWKLGAKPDKDNEKIMDSVEDDIFYYEKYGEDEFDPCDLDVTIDNSSMKDDNLPSEYQPQDSEDECWEQMRAMNNHHQDI